MILNRLEPQRVFYFFEEMSKIPRGSGNEKAVSNYIAKLAKDWDLDYTQDSAYNLIIRKKGTPGYETSPVTILQGHLDMVCEKNMGTDHDFLNDPIELIIDKDNISANGTTLGADNGIAVALSLAVLESKDIPHPPLEVVFTTNEEVGMNGAFFLDGTKLNGKRFINMDTEEEGSIVVSCCGGAKATIILPIKRENIMPNAECFTIKIRGLLGGHSGSEIHLQRASAVKIMGRILKEMEKHFDYRLVDLYGGLMDNAIPRECDAVVTMLSENEEKLSGFIEQIQAVFQKEYKNCDDGIKISCLKSNRVDMVMNSNTTKNAVAVLVLVPYGVQTMVLGTDGLVESSNNLGIVKANDNNIIFKSAARSSVATRKQMLLDELRQISELVCGEFKVSGEYPGWEFNPESHLLQIAKDAYAEINGKTAKVEGIHAGLECGLFFEKVEGLDLISIGPNMWDVHTPNEHLSISSTERTWEYLKLILKKLK